MSSWSGLFGALFDFPRGFNISLGFAVADLGVSDFDLFEVERELLGRDLIALLVRGDVHAVAGNQDVLELVAIVGRAPSIRRTCELDNRLLNYGAVADGLCE